jgi:hypothetical protein
MSEGISVNESTLLSFAEINNPNKITPEQLLIELARISQPNPGEKSDAVSGGFFPNVEPENNKMIIDEKGRVVLKRYADDRERLTKQGRDVTPKEMEESSLGTGSPGGGSVHTSANIEGWHSYMPLYGIFKIPVKDFLENANKGKIILGNLGESEIILTGKIAEKYLDQIYEDKSYREPEIGPINEKKLPKEINISV